MLAAGRMFTLVTGCRQLRSIVGIRSKLSIGIARFTGMDDLIILLLIILPFTVQEKEEISTHETGLDRKSERAESGYRQQPGGPFV